MSVESERAEHPARGDESEGTFWKVYPLREAGKPLRFSVVATVSKNTLRKCRIPAEHATPANRASFAKGAAHALRQEYEDEQRESRERAAKNAPAAGPTFEDVGKLWTTGKLHTEHPDHVKRKKTAADDGERLAVLYKTIGPVALSRFTVDDAQRAMRALPATVKTSGARRHYAQLMARVLSLAAFPLRIIDRSPIPRGFLPRSSANVKAKAWVYPSEDAQLVACDAVPLWRRMLWGMLAREGMREGEALALTWSDVDLERGVIRLDENKTDDPRAWALGADVTRALDAWRKLRKDEKPDAPVFVIVDLHKTQLAETLRADLKRAGVKRAELFESTDTRLALRVHDLRATFVTLALAADRTEAWVTDRTGHRSSDMVHRYKRAARTARELNLGWLVPLDVAVGLTPPAPPKAPPAAVPEPSSEAETAPETAAVRLAIVSCAPAPSSKSGSTKRNNRGSSAWIRTTISGIKIRCPAIERRRSETRRTRRN